MLKTKNKIILFLLVVFGVIMSVNITFFNNNKKVFAENSSEIVMEVSTGRVLYAKNINQKKFMASTTKILTAIIVIENCNLNDKVVVGKETVGIEGSSIYLEAGEILSVKDLLYGLMLRSGNDCAETLAVFCSGSIQKFAEKMNEKALEIGAINSHFVNPHGLHNDSHYTTAYDLALISRYAIKNNDFKEIVSTKRAVIPFSTRNTKRVLLNKNKMLNSLDGATGIKTGFTKKAGRCLVTSCERNGIELVSVVLNCPPMFERSKELLDNCFDNYLPRKIIDSDNVIDFIDINGSNEKMPVYVKNDVVLPLNDNEYKKLKIVYNINKDIKSPIVKNSEVGKIEFYIENNLIYTEKLYNMISI
ncbi:MAG: D-alanyl-D-alanine carboxypeptidase family protein [Clostridia bacterium]|nr:D-alanyl-D-alanine carboxypeptidase family protein [Clostridia bacterium]